MLRVLAVVVIAAACALALGGCGAATGGAAAAADAATVRRIRTPAGGVQPQAVVDAAGAVHLVFLTGDAGASEVSYARLAPGADRFSAPVRVNTVPGSAVAGGTIRGAQIALGRNGMVHVIWNGSGQARPRGPLNPEQEADSPYNGTPLLYSRSTDGGRTFERERNLMQSTWALDGGGTIAADGDGNVYAAWHAGGPGLPRGEAGRRMWIALSRDDGGAWTAEAPAFAEATGACGCCGTRAFADSRGDLALLYRAARDGVERDMYLLFSRDRGESFRGQSLQPWPINTCPMSSATMAETAAGVLAAWETQGQVYFAELDRATGRTSERIAAPGEGSNRKHPAIAVDGAGRIVLAWAEGTSFNRGGDLAWQLFDAARRPAGDPGRVADGIPTRGLPTAVGLPGGGFVIVH